MSRDFIYLDYAASTPVDPAVADLMHTMQRDGGDFANPSALHIAGRKSAAAVALAAKRVATLLHCCEDDLIWTSGATESNNLALQGAAHFRATRGRHLITMLTEHKAVSDVFRALERQGFDVTWLAPQANGLLRLGDLENAIRPDTQLVSVMHVNNETGVIQDIASIGARCRAADILLHVDAAQSAGKLPLDLASLPVDLLSATGHKLYGPKGIGVLYIDRRPGCQLDPLFFGGGQQQRLRPGTLPVALIAGFGLAAELASRSMDDDWTHAQALRTQLWHAIEDLPDLLLNGESRHSYPGILNVSAAGIDGESLLLDLEPLCVATGSACNAQNRDPSAVLRALGRTDDQAQSAIRFSFGRATTVADIDRAASLYRDAVTRLRALAPPAAA